MHACCPCTCVMLTCLVGLLILENLSFKAHAVTACGQDVKSLILAQYAHG